MKLEFSRQIFEKYSNIIFNENPFLGSRVVPCGQTDGRTDGRTDMTKLIVSFSWYCERSWKLLLSYKPRLPCHRSNIPLYPLDTRLVGSQCRYEYKREAKFLSLLIIEYWYFFTSMKYLSESHKFSKKNLGETSKF